jgi:hypothetical protein
MTSIDVSKFPRGFIRDRLGIGYRRSSLCKPIASICEFGPRLGNRCIELRLHVMPRFGSKLLTDIRRDEVKRFVAELSQATSEVNGTPVLKFSRNTLRLIISALRAVINAALEDGIVDSNPASKVGKFAKTEKPARQACAMTREETEEFLADAR